MGYINNKLEEFNKSLLGKKIAIVGMGLSNKPLLDYFSDKGADVTIFNKNAIDDETMKKIEMYEYKVITGEDYLSNLVNFDIIFRSPSALPTIPEFKEAVKNGAILTSEIEMLVELAPCKIIGVTGTEGKTTTSSIIYEILHKSGKKCYLGGNIGNPIFTQLKNITPEDIIVLELSSFQLMGMKKSPNISVVTNIYPDHLNIHSSFEEYVDSKKTIFSNQCGEDRVILNYDNQITRAFEKDAKGQLVYFSSLEKVKKGYIYDRNDGFIKYVDENQIHNIISKNDIKLRGIHNYENICVALAATDMFVSVENQINAIREFTGVEHRLEFVRELNGVKYYNDSIGTSPASTIAGLDSFDENIILLAGGSDKGLDYAEIGEKIAEKVRVLILTGPTSAKIKEATRKALEEKYKNRKIEFIDCVSLQEAVKISMNKAKAGEIVLLSPASASFDAFENYMDRGNKFKQYVNML